MNCTYCTLPISVNTFGWGYYVDPDAYELIAFHSECMEVSEEVSIGV